MDFEQKERYNFADLLRVMEILRGEGGCMWDRAQDHHSIRRCFIEETYEVCEAIDNEDVELLREELGDVLFQVVFHARIEEERGHFNMDDVADGICKKMIFRHPHVFGDMKVQSTGEILQNWDTLKMEEKSQRSATDTLESVARSLPALIRAEKVQSKAEKAGFSPEKQDMVRALDGVQAVLDTARAAAERDEPVDIGALLFAAVEAARAAQIDPEGALTDTTDAYIARFSRMEQAAGKPLAELAPEKQRALWSEAKQHEKE